jgi:hypothetical protein
MVVSSVSFLLLFSNTCVFIIFESGQMLASVERRRPDTVAGDYQLSSEKLAKHIRSGCVPLDQLVEPEPRCQCANGSGMQRSTH